MMLWGLTTLETGALSLACSSPTWRTNFLITRWSPHPLVTCRLSTRYTVINKIDFRTIGSGCYSMYIFCWMMLSSNQNRNQVRFVFSNNLTCLISFFRVIPLPFITTTVGLLWLLVQSTFMLHYVFVQAYIVLSCLFNIHRSICCPSIMLSSFAFSSVSKKQLPTFIDARGYAQFYCNFFYPGLPYDPDLFAYGLIIVI